MKNMPTFKRITMPFSLVLFLLSMQVHAQQGLLEIYQLAERNDPALREAEALYFADLEIKPQARSSLLPSLDFSSSATERSTESPSSAFNFITGEPIPTILRTESDASGNDWSVNLTQTIFNWGQILTLKQADKQITRAEIVYETARQDLLIRVAEAYFNVLAAEDLLAAEVAAREALARQLEQAQRRFEVGLIAITEVQQAQAAFDVQVATEIAAQQTLASQQEFLREIIGEYVVDLKGPIEDLPLERPNPQTPDEWVDAAMEQNLSLLASRIAVDIAQDDIRIQRSVRFPTLNLSAGYSDSDSTNMQTTFYTVLTQCNPFDPTSSALSCSTTSDRLSQGNNLSLNLRVPLFTGGLNRSRIQQSVYRHRATQESLERIARQTERLTRDAYLGVISTISQVTAFRQAVESNRTALRATEAGFEVGTQTTVDVLAAQNNLRRAETNYARSRYDYLLNVLRLRQAAGSLAVADMEQIDGWLE
jgi:outer membrane protein